MLLRRPKLSKAQWLATLFLAAWVVGHLVAGDYVVAVVTIAAAIAALLILRVRASRPAAESAATVVTNRPARRSAPWLILLAQVGGAFSIILLVSLSYGWNGDPRDIELAVISVAVLLACGFTVWHLRDDAMWDKWRS